MKLSIKGTLLLAACASVVCAASIGLYRELTRQINKTSGKPIGTLVLKKKTAVRKYAEYVIWEDIANNTPVFNYDSIRTYPESAAFIKLNDGAEISLDENTMIVLVTDDQGIKINFDQGAISAKSGTSGSSIRLNTRDSSVAMKKGELAVKKDNKTMDINVFSGDAVVSSGGGENRLDVKTALHIADGKTELKKISIVTESPVNDARFVTSADTAKINFKWKSDSDNKHVVEIASDPGFKKILHKENVSGNSYLYSITAGDYFWRIGSGKDYSTIKKFTLMHDTPHRYIYPSKEEKLIITRDDPVNFRWSSSQSGAAYEVEIFTDAGMKTSVAKNILSVNSLSLDKLPAGSLWWRVSRTYPPGFINLDTPAEPVAFKLEQKALTRIKPVPIHNGRVYVTRLSENVPLNWEGAKGSTGYIVEIAMDREFKNIIYTTSTESTFLRVKVPPEGEYFWRVKAVYGKNDYEVSSIVPLTVGIPEPVEYISPVMNQVLENTGNSIRLIWRNSFEASAYFVEIAADPDFRKILSSGTTRGSEYTTNKPGTGKYYWRVSILDKFEKVTVTGLTSAFLIPSALDKPKIISPENLAKVNLDDIDVLRFQWAAVKGADSYELEIFHRSSGIDRSLIVMNTASTKIELRNFRSLEPGTLVWVVRARKKSGSRIAAVSESERVSFVLKVNEDIQAPKIQLQEKYYVR